MISVSDIKKLRELTGAGIADCREALSLSKGNVDKAVEIIREKGFEKAEKKSDRETAAGVVDAYIHSGNKVGALVEIRCETDFVARTEEFKKLVHEVAMQVASMHPKDVTELLNQDYIRDGSKKIGDLVKEAVAKLGENIKIENISWMRIAAGSQLKPSDARIEGIKDVGPRGRPLK